MGLRVEGDTVVYLWVLLEELLQYIVVVLFLFVERQVHLCDLDVRIVVHHVVTESRLTVSLLFRTHESVARLLHQGHLFLFIGNEHQHLRCEVAAGEGVLSEEGQWLQVWHIRVEKHVGDLLLRQLLRESCRLLQGGGYDDDAIEFYSKELAHHTREGSSIETLVVHELQVDAEVPPEVGTGQCAFLNLVPVGLLLVLGQHAIEGVCLVVGQC